YPVVAQGVPISKVHEPKLCATFQGSWVTEDRGHTSSALHLVQQFGHVIEAGRHYRDPCQNHDGLLRIERRQSLVKHIPKRLEILVGKVGGHLILGTTVSFFTFKLHEDIHAFSLVNGFPQEVRHRDDVDFLAYVLQPCTKPVDFPPKLPFLI